MELKPEHITCIIDTREQLPFDLSPLKVIRGSLSTGDYSVDGLTHCISVERKSLADLVMCVGSERERFEKEIQRLLAYETRAIIVEASWKNLDDGGWRSRVPPKAVVGSVLSWIARGIPICMAGDRDRGARICGHLLFLAARRRWRELKAFNESVGDTSANGTDKA
jgi:DNA excision repair protein ERCC-4